ncbi:Tetratricopeptide TPR_1 repeat-containing protein [Candidatus Sulfobium mesophilum]|uniref:Tetratricopeptide TPR_1 repeat-containing protein n=1 Tax=Candidatus Sulfobium mesophilum TaxID=2016548 RepID=A0A2U3QGM6_9BACT|nr:Tetratricopeptide TPR_1 repeat-containing protein [Candidatus Sulfobium mesophilum]
MAEENLQIMKYEESTLPRFAVLIPFLLIAFCSFLSYSNTFHVPFQLDDQLNISAKPYVKDISAFFDPAKIEHYRDDDPFRMRMVGYFTFAVNYRLHGNEVVGYHVVNLAIHIINGFLVYVLVLLTFRTPFFSNSSTSPVQPMGGSVELFIALFAALLFVCHPIQTQAVTYIVQRLASLATLFYILSLVAYIKWRLIVQETGVATRNNKPLGRSGVWYLSSLVSVVLAMKTKEVAFTLPLVVVLYEFLFFAGTVKKRVLCLVPFLLTLLIVPFELMGLEKPAGAVMGEMNSALRASSDLSRWDYLFTQFRVIVTYVRLLFFPANQNLDYDYPVYHSFFSGPVFLSFLLLSCMFGMAVYLLYKSRQRATGKGQNGKTEGQGDVSPVTHHLSPLPYYRLIAFGIFWFFITLSVESSVIPIADVIFEHRLYLPSVGFFLAATVALYMLWQRANESWKVPAKFAVAVCGLIIAILTGAAYARNTQWKDEVRLWEDVVKKSPSKVRPRSNLGYFYGKQGRLEDAVREYQIALRIDPDDFQVHDNLGVIYKVEGRIEEAIREYRTALRLKPEDAMAYYNLGNIFREQGNFEEAIKQYQTAIRLEPEIEVAVLHNNLGIAYIGLGNLKEAEREFRIAIGLDPDYEAAGRNLEMLLRGTGR